MTRRIMHVIEPAPFGGAESVVAALAGGAARRGATVHVALLQQGAPHAADPPLAEALRAAAVPVTVLRCGRRRYLREIDALATLIAAQAPQIVHTHVYHADLVGGAAARRAAVPVVATVHGFTRGNWKNRLYEWLDLLALDRCDAVICVSDTVAERVRRAGVSPRRVHVVPNGVAAPVLLPREEARRALGIAADGRAVGWIGRLSAEKGPDLFIAAMRALGGGAAGIMVGGGPLERSLAEGAAAAGVRLVGARPGSGTLLAAFDVVALSSRTEGLPIALLEAMAAGVPVVAFGVGGIPLALAGGAGWVVAPGDVQGLADGIRDALDHGAEAARRAAIGRQRVEERFGMTHWLDGIDAVYSAVTP